MASKPPLVYRGDLGHAGPIQSGDTIVVPVLAADPPGTTAGESYYSSTLGCLRTYNGSVWTGAAAAVADEALAYFLS